MKKKIGKILALVLVVVMSLALFGGCTTDNGDQGDVGAKKHIKLGYVNWAEGVAMTNLAKAIFEEKLDYTCEITMADVAPIFTSIANGDYDAFLDAWLPVTHESYIEEYGDNLVNLGINYEGARIGLVVPSYVEIDSIEEMNSIKDQVDGRIVGIDAGAGIMRATERAIPAYELDYELQSASDPVMVAALKTAIDKEEPVIVTGWAPHWKFARWDLKFLEDPQKVFGDVEHVYTIARVGIEEDLPEAAEFLTNFKLDDQQLGDLMGRIADGQDEFEAATEWMNENEDLVNSWIGQ